VLDGDRNSFGHRIVLRSVERSATSPPAFGRPARSSFRRAERGSGRARDLGRLVALRGGHPQDDFGSPPPRSPTEPRAPIPLFGVGCSDVGRRLSSGAPQIRRLTTLEFCCAPKVLTASAARDPHVRRANSNSLLGRTGPKFSSSDDERGSQASQ